MSNKQKVDHRKKRVGLNNIKAVIKSQGRNELWVAEQVGISKTSLSNYCAFLREPPLDLLFRLSSVLKVPLISLINLEAKVEPKPLKKTTNKSVKAGTGKHK